MTVLWFSGGKDSMACLYLLRAQLHGITVLWANTGKNVPEVLETVAKARAMCPNWIEVRSDRDAQWAANGLPADMVPIEWTVPGQSISSDKPFRVQSYLKCCWENIGGALWAKSNELGATVVIRGQRADESHKAPAKHGDRLDGVVFCHPVEGWTRDQVLAYLRREMGELPSHYCLDHSSVDCYDCTAFAAHSADRADYLRERHPAMHREYMDGMQKLRGAMEQVMQPYLRITEAACQ